MVKVLVSCNAIGGLAGGWGQMGRAVGRCFDVRAAAKEGGLRVDDFGRWEKKEENGQVTAEPTPRVQLFHRLQHNEMQWMGRWMERGVCCVHPEPAPTNRRHVAISFSLSLQLWSCTCRRMTSCSVGSNEIFWLPTGRCLWTSKKMFRGKIARIVK